MRPRLLGFHRSATNVEVLVMRALLLVGILLLCVSRVSADEKAPADKPAAKGEAAAADPLRDVRARILIAEQQLTETVNADLRKARRGYPDDPEAALKVLRGAVLRVWDHPDISERVRDDLLGKLVTARRQLVKKGAEEGR
jgi:hypothetical protein